VTARPMVGVTWTTDIVARSAGGGENALRYMEMLSGAGLVPVLLTPGTSSALLARLDGLLLPGGPDIAPSHYGEQPAPELEAVDGDLDELELEMVGAARARSLPILGICRGQQLINVALGGTLRQHIEHPQWEADPSAPMHEVRILGDTRLHRILGVDVAAVNSGHHQAVGRLAAPLTAAALSDDGVIEAVEGPELMVMAVQWHPEEMPGTELTKRLAAGFAGWIVG